MNIKGSKDVKTVDTEHLIEHKLAAPRSAAIAGILFALLFSASWLLIRLSLPAEALEADRLLGDRAKNLALAMSLIPFSGISFLWFMGVVRDRMGRQQDQFFSTLHIGSGYLCLGMTFASAAMIGGALVLYVIDLQLSAGSGMFSLALVVSTGSIACTRCAWRECSCSSWALSGFRPR